MPVFRPTIETLTYNSIPYAAPDARCEKIYENKVTGTRRERAGLEGALREVRNGNECGP